jgi:hypothetical protein
VDPKAGTGQNKVTDLLCVHYLTGFLDGYLAGSIHPQGRALCVPKAGIPIDLLKAIVVKHLLKSDSQLDDPGFTARVAMLEALVDEYPCQTTDR